MIRAPRTSRPNTFAVVLIALALAATFALSSALGTTGAV